MKFMKLGSKPDSFQTEGHNIRYVTAETATDIVVNVMDVKFYLHKFPLLTKSARLQKLLAIASEESKEEIPIVDLPGGSAAFEICIKYCYGMTVTLNAYNVVAARCAAEYLEMYETVDKGNLIYKIDVFLNSGIFRGWKDSIIVLKTTKSLLPWSEELKLVSHCLDAIASKASVDTSRVEWSYTYNRKKLPSENGEDPLWNSMKKQQSVPEDWWVEDLCDLDVNNYKRVITTIKTKGRVSAAVVGEALRAYALRRLPGFSKGTVQGGDPTKNRFLVETIVRLLPAEKGGVSCSFLLALFRAARSLECAEVVRKQLMRRIGQQLEEASVGDLLIRAPAEETMIYDVDVAYDLVKEFLMSEQGGAGDDLLHTENEFFDIKNPVSLPVSDASKATVAKLVDCYLAEVAHDPNLPLLKFLSVAQLVSGFSRPSHDGIYRAIDTYLKEHPGISKGERRRICKLMDCRKLSVDACAHVVQNEHLPLRVVVQVLFFEQARAAASSTGGGSATSNFSPSMRTLFRGGSHYGSSRSATTADTDEDWDGLPTIEELKALKGELANLRLGGGEGISGSGKKSVLIENHKNDADQHKVDASKVKGLLMSRRLFSKLWSGKEKEGENSSSETSESPAPAHNNAEDIRLTYSRSRRH